MLIAAFYDCGIDPQKSEPFVPIFRQVVEVNRLITRGASTVGTATLRATEAASAGPLFPLLAHSEITLGTFVALIDPVSLHGSKVDVLLLFLNHLDLFLFFRNDEKTEGIRGRRILLLFCLFFSLFFGLAQFFGILQLFGFLLLDLLEKFLALVVRDDVAYVPSQHAEADLVQGFLHSALFCRLLRFLGLLLGGHFGSFRLFLKLLHAGTVSLLADCAYRG